MQALLQQNFFDRYPQYKFIQQIDLNQYPTINAEFAFTEKLRLMIVRLLDPA